MKRIIALAALCLGCSSAMANTGIINFEGTVSAGGTCPIDVVTPGGPSLPKIMLGNFRTTDFKATGDRTPAVRFGLRHDPQNCALNGDKATVRYSATYGATPGGLYALQDGVGYSEGLALAIYDASNQPLAPDTDSMEYTLSATAPTDMNFSTRLEAIEDTVTEGHVSTSVNFVVDIQ
ncbi:MULTISPECIES: fimbrial protein [unclassified Pseudomonas]|uniref:fimbrial protein n=1 Tax=unclassified Pseudomonas TaxID=196821 RepID=UPI00257A877E|nr:MULTISPECIES: fimbrial protein [unclassified Pseudomonas]